MKNDEQRELLMFILLHPEERGLAKAVPLRNDATKTEDSSL